jgi:hypothetical protein
MGPVPEIGLASVGFLALVVAAVARRTARRRTFPSRSTAHKKPPRADTGQNAAAVKLSTVDRKKEGRATK